MSDERNAKLRTDNGGELYVSKDFDNYFTSKGVEHQLTIPHSPQQYTVAERLNCTTIGSAWSLLSHSKLPNKLWAEVVVTAVYVRNHVTTCVNEEWITPFEKWYGHTQDVSHLRVFGCTAYCLFPVLKEESSTRRLNLCLITARTLSNWITTPRLLLLQS